MTNEIDSDIVEASPTKQSGARRLTKAVALLVALGLVAAACGADDADSASAQASTTVAEEAMEDEESMADEEAMEDEEAMADDEEAMADDAMEDDAMEDGRPALNISFDGLEPLGDDFNYEGWVIVDGAPVSSGVFDIAEDGSIESDSALYSHEGATAVVISIEPEDDPDPAPADAKILGGEINADGSFDLSIDFAAALGTDFSDASGSFILATPTDDPEDNERSGVWFLNLPDPSTSLVVPELPAGWVYEGWAVIDGQPVSTGRFTDPAAADDSNLFSGPGDGPNYPGEDFLTNAPEGLEFPTDLRGSTIVVSVEPADDNSPAPFALKPLVAEVGADAEDHVNFDLGAGPVAITGSGTVG